MAGLEGDGKENMLRGTQSNQLAQSGGTVGGVWISSGPPSVKLFSVQSPEKKTGVEATLIPWEGGGA